MKKTILSGLLLTISFIFSSIALASISKVTSKVNKQDIPADQTTNRTITWSITATPKKKPVGTITSPSITFRATSATGAILGTSAKSISRTASKAGTYTLLEHLKIPGAVVYRASKLGASRIIVLRTFNDSDTGSATGQSYFDITTSSAASFNINSISIRFDNNQPQRSIKRFARDKAYIKLAYSGSGLLKGTWEIATPSTTIGDPVYKRLQTVRRRLPGTGIIKIYSPRLPTRVQGVYQLRFKIDEPALSFKEPLARYFVYTGSKPLLSPLHISLQRPGPSTALDDKTIFSWHRVKNASALRLELYVSKTKNTAANDKTSPAAASSDNTINDTLIAGKLLRGTQHQTTLSKSTIAKLKPGRWYLWRLVAFNKKGHIIGVSEPRKLYTPAK